MPPPDGALAPGEALGAGCGTSEPFELKSKVLAEAGPAIAPSANATATTPRIRRKTVVQVIDRPPVGWIAGAIRVASSLWEDGDAWVTFALPVLSQLRDRLRARIIACNGGRIPGVAAVSDAWSAGGVAWRPSVAARRGAPAGAAGVVIGACQRAGPD